MLEILCVLMIIYFILYTMYIYNFTHEHYVNNINNSTNKNYYFYKDKNIHTFLREHVSEITNTSARTQELPLKMCIVQSSYNTALGSNNKVSVKNIVTILRMGCRFIDFELFYDSNTNTTVVATSKDKDRGGKSSTISSLNTLLFHDVCKVIIKNAFTLPCLNHNDPLFLHLRIQSTDNKILHSIAMTLDKYFDNNIIFTNNFNGDTLVKALMGKVVIIFDNYNLQNVTDSKLYPNCHLEDDATNNINRNNTIVQKNICYYLPYYISVVTNTNRLQSTTYTTLIKQVYTNINDNAYQLKVILPDDKMKDNIMFNEVTIQYGIQFLPMKYYHFDHKVELYVHFFSKYAILPLQDVYFFTA